MSRVFVLASGGTASASEAFINGLRGIDVEVILIGANTRGKPYGFYGIDNCSTTYFTIQFKGSNAKGFGEYSDGFIPVDSDDMSAANVRDVGFLQLVVQAYGRELDKEVRAQLLLAYHKDWGCNSSP